MKFIKKYWLRLLLIILLAATLAFTVRYVSRLHVSNLIVLGNEIYTEEEIRDMIFETDKDTLYWRILTGRVAEKRAPLLERYELEALDFKTAQVTVYEKTIVGCFVYMDHYMYFDREGVIQESSSKHYTNVPVVYGLEFGHVAMMQPLPVEDPKVFTYLMNLMQLIEVNNIKVERTVYDSELNATLYLSDPDTVRVYMGAPEYMQDKVLLLSDILPKLKDLSGTLYLDDYNPNSYDPKYLFKKDGEAKGSGKKSEEEPETETPPATENNPEAGNEPAAENNPEAGNEPAAENVPVDENTPAE
ncbi:MAG: hypothetical protein J5825_06215 [Lachnospiraceae bacterium]|nr:hypothetical protein [Lachnospiraceae bacterium]